MFYVRSARRQAVHRRPGRPLPSGVQGPCYGRVERVIQVAQLSQRDHAAGFVSFVEKWKTGTGKQCFGTV